MSLICRSTRTTVALSAMASLRCGGGAPREAHDTRPAVSFTHRAGGSGTHDSFPKMTDTPPDRLALDPRPWSSFTRRAGGSGTHDGFRKMTDTPPDRLALDPRSPYYDAEALNRGVGVRFNGEERDNVEEYSVSEGWIRVQVGRSRD